MYKIRITAAIEYYNMNSKDEKTLTRKVLSSIILPDIHQKTAEQYLASWNNGKKMSALKPEHIHGICEVTGVDVNFLYGIREMKK